jgi:CubicO group peptidase (beta-lactamase class C family)
VTLRNLLCHTAGLPVDLPNEHDLYGKMTSWKEIEGECLRVEQQIPARTRVVYGNVGYGLLALAVERVTGKEFRDALGELALAPLGIDGYLGGSVPREPMKLLGVRSRHVGTPLEPYNSRYYLNLGLPWSGLITTPEGALKLVQEFAGRSARVISETTRQEATENQTDQLPGGYGAAFEYAICPWGLGVDLRGEKKPHWTPSNASPKTFGHAGASGCVTWHDPERKVGWAILGTRTADNGWLVRGARKLGEWILEQGG